MLYSGMKRAKMNTRRYSIWVALLLLLLLQSPLSGKEPYDYSPGASLTRDQGVVLKIRQGLSGVISYLTENRNLSSKVTPLKTRLLDIKDRTTVRQLWQRFLDYMSVLDRLGYRYAALYKDLEGGFRKDVFFTSYAIFLARYRFALAFMEAVEKNATLHVLLNEPVPELGLGGGTYSHLKNEILNPLKAGDFLLMEANDRLYGESPPPLLAQGIQEDRHFIWKAARGMGPELTAKNAVRQLQDVSFKAWLPVQTKAAEWLGDTRVWRKDRNLITKAQINAMRSLLKPGDILLARREWYLSNIGLPGFWTHSLIYVGTPGERRRYFREDEKVILWTQTEGIHSGDFEQLLRFHARDAYERNRKGDGTVPELSVIESKSEGVSLSSLEHAALADSLVVLRTRLPRISKAQALLRAFSYVGRPYDFNFDFLTDSQMVCTEVIYKAYEPTSSTPGLRLPLMNVLGRQLMTANDLAKLFDRAHGSPDQQFEFILFLDGNEREEMAAWSDEEHFRKTWKRPKWHAVVPQ